MLLKSSKNFDQKLSLLAFLVICISFAILLSVPLWDIDLWWHLASGKQIFTGKELLKSDPFCFTSEQGIDTSREFVLNAYWLSQVLFYISYLLAGNYGLIAFRVLIFLLIFLAVFIFCRKHNISPGLTSFTLLLCGWASLFYTGERPQLFTFLFAALLLLLFEGIGPAKKSSDASVHTYKVKKALLVPVMMFFWANVHPGFFLGAVLIILFVGSEVVKKFLLKYLLDKKSFYRMSALTLSGIIVSLINPNLYKPYWQVVRLEGSILQQRTSEYLSPLVLWKQGVIVYPYGIYLLLSLFILIWFYKKMDLTHIIILGFLLILSLRAHRYIPFFVFGTSFILAKYASDNIMEKNRRRKLVNITGVLMVLVLIFFTVRGFNSSLGLSIKSPLNESRFPVKAPDFIMQHKPRGNIFNHFNWGGYLEWRLFPDYKVFIDGRSLSLRAFHDYTQVLWDREKGRSLLDAYGVNVVIMPAINPFTGELYEMTNYLYEDKNWYLVYRDELAVILLRGKSNDEVISRRSLPKIEIYTHAILQAKNLVQSGMNNYHLWMALYKAYMAKGMYIEAESAGRMAKQLR